MYSAREPLGPLLESAKSFPFGDTYAKYRIDDFHLTSNTLFLRIRKLSTSLRFL